MNTSERRAFAYHAGQEPPLVRAFCLVLLWSGCRLTEALNLSATSFDLDAGWIEFRTLKRRRMAVRQVPIPKPILTEIAAAIPVLSSSRERLWGWSRSTAWRHVKRVMRLAGLEGSFAMPKGLRHTFGVTAFGTVPPHLVQRWLGHASLRTTAIYGDVIGPEETNFATRMWAAWK